MNASNCPSCGAVLKQLPNGDAKCEFCGAVLRSGEGEIPFDTLLERVTEAMSSGNAEVAKRMSEKLTEDHPKNAVAWLARGNCSTKVSDRDYAYSMAKPLIDGTEDVIVGFAWDPMLFNWGCHLELEGRTIPLGPSMKYRTVAKKGQLSVGLVSPKNRMSTSSTFDVKESIEIELSAKVGLLNKQLVMKTKRL
jgi:uncharacterized Zn finger protein (UPF0148 family)